MNTLLKSLLIGLAASFCYFSMPVESAHAAKVPLIFNTGEDIFVAGDGSLPAPFVEVPDLAGAQAGYKCDVFGVLWAYFSISNCKPVAFKGDTFWDDAELSAAVAKAHPEDSMNVGFWAGYGKFPLGLIILGGIGFFIWSKLKGDDDDDEEEQTEQPAAS